MSGASDFEGISRVETRTVSRLNCACSILSVEAAHQHMAEVVSQLSTAQLESALCPEVGLRSLLKGTPAVPEF